MPTKNPHNEYIKQQIHQGNFKWAYTETRYNEDDIRQLIAMNKIKIAKFRLQESGRRDIQKDTEWTDKQITTRGTQER